MVLLVMFVMLIAVAVMATLLLFITRQTAMFRFCHRYCSMNIIAMLYKNIHPV